MFRKADSLIASYISSITFESVLGFIFLTFLGIVGSPDASIEAEVLGFGMVYWVNYIPVFGSRSSIIMKISRLFSNCLVRIYDKIVDKTRFSSLTSIRAFSDVIASWKESYRNTNAILFL